MMVADCRIHIEVTDPVIRTVSFTLSLIVLAYFVRGAVSVDATSKAWSDDQIHHPSYSQCLLDYMANGGDSEQESYIEDCLEGFPDFDYDYVDTELDMDVVGARDDPSPHFPPKSFFEDMGMPQENQNECPPGVLGGSLSLSAICLDGVWVDQDFETSTSTTTPTPPPMEDTPEMVDMSFDQEKDGTLLALQVTLPIICFGVIMFLIYLGLPFIKGFYILLSISFIYGHLICMSYCLSDYSMICTQKTIF